MKLQTTQEGFGPCNYLYDFKYTEKKLKVN